MLKGRASLTALAVASARALASHTQAALVDPQDRLAERLLPDPVARALRLLQASALGRGPIASTLARASLGMVDHLALRSAIIDERLEAALAAGVRQLVILGAGFDTRAHRLAALAQTDVYEVDHPDSQRKKRAGSAALPACARSLEYVALDFANAELAARLAHVGHRSDAPSFWLAEGLLPYLTPATYQALLHAVAHASAPGSQLLLTYVTPDLVWLRHARGLLLGSLRLIGEPMHNLLAADDVTAALAPLRFSTEEDSDTHDWARELSGPSQHAPLIAYERMRLARKR